MWRDCLRRVPFTDRRGRVKLHVREVVLALYVCSRNLNIQPGSAVRTRVANHAPSERGDRAQHAPAGVPEAAAQFWAARNHVLEVTAGNIYKERLAAPPRVEAEVMMQLFLQLPLEWPVQPIHFGSHSLDGRCNNLGITTNSVDRETWNYVVNSNSGSCSSPMRTSLMCRM
jgi:hypothetical protein